MPIIRRAADRGYADHGWLDSYHTFSFAGYHDPAHMGFRALRVINEDRVAPGEGFDTHPHRDMEILTYVISGELAHKDSMGNGRVIKPKEVQGMSAGTGITHSEFNASADTLVHLLQIWIQPHTKGVPSSYAEWLPDGREQNGWALVAGEKGEAGSIRIHQDARMYVVHTTRSLDLPLPLSEKRYGWLQVATGQVMLGSETLLAGDGVAFSLEKAEKLHLKTDTTLLFFDLG